MGDEGSREFPKLHVGLHVGLGRGLFCLFCSKKLFTEIYC